MLTGAARPKEVNRPPCPFQTEQGPCGSPVRFHDADGGVVKCRKGHITPVEALAVPPVGVEAPSWVRLRRRPRVTAGGVALAAVAVDVASRLLA